MANILIACEYSGIVREEFNKKGHHAVSCDLLDTDIITKNHYKGNVKDILYKDWDLLIAFPPCTYLTSSGSHLYDINKYGNKAIQRFYKRNEAINFFLDLYSAPIKHICIENPTGHINTNVIKESQIIHPYYFGDRNMKRTCLWLKNLPLLEHYKENDLFNIGTHTIKPDPISTDKKTGKNRYFTDGNYKGKFLTPHERNKTFKVIAEAMANQWSNLI